MEVKKSGDLVGRRAFVMPKKPKTLLIWPPLSGRLEAAADLIIEPLGLAYIAAVLEEAGYPVEILDAMALAYDQFESLEGELIRVGLNETQLKERIARASPDIIGIGCMFSANEPDFLRVAKFAKEVCPGALVILGGPHATSSPASLLRNEDVDLVVQGEGETTFLELVKCVETESAYTSLPSIVSKNEDGSLQLNPRREPIADLDSLPFPARHLLPMEKYFEFQKKGRVMYRYYMRKPIANIITSRGCPYNCVFCAVRTVWGQGWRGRSPENVLEELKLLTREYGIKEFTPWDDNIGCDKKRLINLCDQIIEAGLNLRWATPNGIYLWNLDEEVLTKLKKSGYYRITLGLESGDPRTLKFIGKPVDFEKARRIISLCDRLGIWTHSSFIIGFPNEDRESVEKTLKAPIDLKLDFAAFFVAQPFIGTRLYDIYVKEGLLNPEEQQLSWTSYPTYNTKYFTSQELHQLQQKAYYRVIWHRIRRLINPMNLGQVFFKINSPEKFRYFLRLGRNLVAGVWVGRARPVDITVRKQ